MLVSDQPNPAMALPQERDYLGLSPAAAATELRLGLPGSASPEREDNNNISLGPLTLELLPKGSGKRGFEDVIVGSGSGGSRPGFGREEEEKKKAPAAKAQVVGWPPIRSYRKNTMAIPSKNKEETAEAKQEAPAGCLYVKVSMDGVPYLRKVDLKIYTNYKELSEALQKMFIIGHGESKSDCPLMELKNGPELVLTYEDKDGDWMLVGDVPWGMFTSSCRRLRIMKGSDAVGLAPRAMEKTKNRT